MRDRRRGERVLIRIPVEVRGSGADGAEIKESAETAVVSRFGALLCTATRLQKGAVMKVTHGFSHDTEEFRVVWSGDAQKEGRWEAGVEALNPRDDFWGIHFPPSVPRP